MLLSGGLYQKFQRGQENEKKSDTGEKNLTLFLNQIMYMNHILFVNVFEDSFKFCASSEKGIGMSSMIVFNCAKIYCCLTYESGVVSYNPCGRRTQLFSASFFNCSPGRRET